MDTLSHGLWGGAVFGRDPALKRPWLWAFVLGMTPDLLSFGPFFVTRFPFIWQHWAHRTHMEPPDPHIIPAYVYHAYNITHSLVVWVLLFAGLWFWRKRCPWVLGAWGLHILCDIPTHSTRFFPTPYLWPFPTPFVNGMPWGRRWFMLTNYTCIAIAYLIVTYRRKTSAKA